MNKVLEQATQGTSRVHNTCAGMGAERKYKAQVCGPLPPTEVCVAEGGVHVGRPGLHDLQGGVWGGPTHLWSQSLRGLAVCPTDHFAYF